MTAPAKFNQADVTRAMKGALKAGYNRVQVTIDLQGRMVVDACVESVAAQPVRRNPLDRLLESAG